MRYYGRYGGFGFTSFILNAAFHLNQTESWDLKTKIRNTQDKFRERSTTNPWKSGKLRSTSLSAILENHSDLPRSVPKLFFSSWVINIFLFAITAALNMLVLLPFLASIFGKDIGKDIYFYLEKNWTYLILTNVFCLVFLVHYLSDAYKISLRGNYRNQYLKVLGLDLLTLNFLSVIGIFIFSSNRVLMFKDDQDNVLNFATPPNQKVIKKYNWAILRAHLVVFFVIFILYLLFFLTGYFVKNEVLQTFCFTIFILLSFFLYSWVLPNTLWILIAQRMLIKLTQTTSTFYFLSVIHFLGMRNTYYLAIFLNLLSFENPDEVYILENW